MVDDTIETDLHAESLLNLIIKFHHLVKCGGRIKNIAFRICKQCFEVNYTYMMCVNACMCVCVCERDRQRGGRRERERERKRGVK